MRRQPDRAGPPFGFFPDRSEDTSRSRCACFPSGRPQGRAPPTRRFHHRSQGASGRRHRRTRRHRWCAGGRRVARAYPAGHQHSLFRPFQLRRSQDRQVAARVRAKRRAEERPRQAVSRLPPITPSRLRQPSPQRGERTSALASPSGGGGPPPGPPEAGPRTGSAVEGARPPPRPRRRGPDRRCRRRPPRHWRRARRRWPEPRRRRPRRWVRRSAAPRRRWRAWRRGLRSR